MFRYQQQTLKYYLLCAYKPNRVNSYTKDVTFYCKNTLCSNSHRDLLRCLPDLGIHCEHRQLDQPHLTVSPVKDIYRYNEAVSLQCDEGYILRVPSSARCTEDFVFDIPSTSVCEGIVIP